MGTAAVRLGATRTVIPGVGLPAGAPALRSNNNVDVVDFGGRRYLGWRTASTHFASTGARLHVVASDDAGETWTHETTIAMGRDVREPRLFTWAGGLFFTFFEGGTDPKKFQPGRIFMCERAPDGSWTSPEPVSPTGCVVWRVRELGGRLVMSVYRGAETLFTAHPEPIRVELWTTGDCYDWRPLDPDRPVLHHGGTETEFVETGDGRVVYICRKEGPAGGWGTDIGVASADTPLDVRWFPDARKADSPCLFTHRSGVYLITRRQLANGGRFDLGWTHLSPTARTRAYQALYWLSRKRTTLYQVVIDGPGAPHLDEVCDLPSSGDTAFAAVVATDGGPVHDADHLTAYNYTSPIGGPDLPWCVAQLRPTTITATELRMP